MIRRLRVAEAVKTVFQVGSPPQAPDGVDDPTRQKSLEIDKAIKFLLYSMFENVRHSISNNSLYSLRNKRSELDKSCSNETVIPW